MRYDALKNFVVTGDEAVTYLSGAQEILGVLDLGVCSLHVVRHDGQERLLVTTAGGEAANLPADVARAVA